MVKQAIGVQVGFCAYRPAGGILLAGIALGVMSASTLAQVQSPGGAAAQQVQRDARLRELQQIELDTRLRANEAIPPGQRLLVDYGAYLQLNYLSLDDAAHNNHGLREGDLVPYLRLNFDGAQELFIRGRIGYRDFNTGDSFTGRGDEPVDGDLDRGYYRLDLARYNAAYGTNLLGAKTGQSNLIFEGGRDLAYWANGLVLAQTLDGIFIDVQHGIADVQVVAGVTPVRTVDFDTSRPAFDYNTRRGFFGAMGSVTLGDHHPFVYGLVQRDFNEDNFLSLGPVDTRFSYNSFYLGAGSTGALSDNLRYGVEAAYENGDDLSTSFVTGALGGPIAVPQTRDSIQAWAADARLDYLFNDRHDTRLSGEFIIASGDPDRGSSSQTFNGNRPGSSDTAFNGFGLLNTGLAFAPEVSNIMVFRVGGSTFPLVDYEPTRRLQIGADLLFLAKARKDAPINETTSDHRYLGIEPDLYLNWQLSSDVTLALRYGVFVPGSRTLPSDTARQFFFAGLTFSF